ncbi:hypothetical protein LDENG_00223070 [Lucifuga dentata]|nr:hypothetical protein LDENG_00223070 [Lucifuga dentata]
MEMELHMHKHFHHSQQGDDRSQMLNLNRRLETYLGRVKLLEGENELLCKEIRALRCSGHKASSCRKGLEEELQRARLELDEAWRERTLTELEVCKLSEELRALDLQGQREAEAWREAKMKLEQSRKELEEEQRAQIWLREKVNQLEQEMKFLIQTHQEDMAHMEATLTRSRTTAPPMSAPMGNQMPNLLQLGQKYSQRATRAWQEATEAYQGQLERLEESLNQTRSCLTHVGQERSESLLKLQALEKELGSAQDIRIHLETTAAQQRDRHSQEIQILQEHLRDLETEKEELGQQIDRLVGENRGLLQLKMSLGLEVATYRALLDGESLRGDVSSINQPRNLCIADAVFSPRGLKENYPSQLSTGHKTSVLSSVYSRRIRSTPAAITPASVWNRKLVSLEETPKTLRKPVQYQTDEELTKTTKSTTWGTPYPKVLLSGAVENFRPQEVEEKVTHAEPLSPPNEQEVLNKTTAWDEEAEEDWNNLDAVPPEEASVVASAVGYQVESSFSSEPPLNDEAEQHRYTTTNVTPRHAQMTEESRGLLDESDKDVPAEKEEMQEPHLPVEAWMEMEMMIKEAENVHEEASDSETEAMLEPTFESRTSSPASECGPEESVFSHDGKISNDDADVNMQEINSSMGIENEPDFEDKLYPDGEEMDTWDSVIERKDGLKKDENMENDEGNRQHAEPEEDISAREPEHGQRGTRQDVPASTTQQESNMDSSAMDTKEDDDGQNSVLDKEQLLEKDKDKNDDDEEDSQNVSVSWRTELESDSYAQDNTLADTRPLIRYKSDETDVNTQALHMEESESSEGEEEGRKTGETGSGAWSGSKSKRSGTMEDLCEEVEGEGLNEEYDLGYTHAEDKDVGRDVVKNERDILVNDEEKGEEIRKVSEEQSDEENEEAAKLAGHMVFRDLDYNEELEINRLVEQELENLSTDSYSTHFAQQKVSQNEAGLKETTEEEEAVKTNEDVLSWIEQEVMVSSSKNTHQAFEEPYFSDTSEMPHTDMLAEDEVQHDDEETTAPPEKMEEEVEQHVWMVTRSNVTEDQTSSDPVTADMEDFQDIVKGKEASSTSREHPVQEVADCQEFPEFPETAEWEVLENSSKDLDIRSQSEDSGVAGSRYLHNEAAEMQNQVFLDRVPDDADIFHVKNSTESLKTNSKDNSLHGIFSSGVNNDLWVSSLETGAAYQPDDACSEADEWSNQNRGFGDSLVWRDFENPNLVNGNSRMDTDSSKAGGTKKEQEQMEVKQAELINSEESEDEGESWSSGKEYTHKAVKHSS